ncbi:MAG: adenosine deaminase [Gemmatimonas sp. SG8_38_2]|nr:MAG: adenosine deaminase [Gemmatimonas sp. SG8_38_2]
MREALSADVRSRLIEAARGDAPSDTLLKNARLVNVRSGEIHDADIAIYEGRIAGFGAYQAREVIDLRGQHVCPGLIDAHVHIESSMVTVPEFARAVVPRGTTAVVTDPHEIANVLGVPGIRYMLDSSEGLPLHVFAMASSCVPATDMETSGAKLEAADLVPLFEHPHVIGLAEVMNFPGVFLGAPDVLAKVDAAGDRPVDGHSPGLSGFPLNAYAAAGIGSDHECTRLEEAREKLRLGMHLFIREGTTARNLDALLPLVTAENSPYCSFCTDDRHPEDLLDEGHIDALIRMAISRGLNPLTAIQMATINTANYFGLRGLGMVAPGYRADLVVFDDFQDFSARKVLSGGEVVAEEGEYLGPRPVPRAAPGSGVNVNWGAVQLGIEVDGDPRVRVIEAVPGQIITKQNIEEVEVADGMAVTAPQRDLLKIAVIERHHGSGNLGIGFVRGFGLKRGAIASTVAHDNHNIVVVGASDDDMMTAAQAVAETGGGQAVVAGGRVLASVPLPIAGLMSDLPLEDVRDGVEAMTAAARDLGGTLPDPLMTMSFLALAVIPELKITDLGLVDVGEFKRVPLFVSDT